MNTKIRPHTQEPINNSVLPGAEIPLSASCCTAFLSLLSPSGTKCGPLKAHKCPGQPIFVDDPPYVVDEIGLLTQAWNATSSLRSPPTPC